MAKPTGRPPHVPTDKEQEVVKALATHGIPQEKIANYIGIDKKTLAKRYELELEDIEKFKTKVTAHLHQRVFKNDTILMFFFNREDRLAGYGEQRPPLNINFRVTARGERIKTGTDDGE